MMDRDGSGDQDDVIVWLGLAAGLHEDVVNEAKLRLRSEQVYVVGDLALLVEEGGLSDVFTTPRGSDCACQSDGGDSDGQGTPQGGGGVRSPPRWARAAEIFQVFRGQEASFMRKIGTSFRQPSRPNPAFIV